ncbi:phosphopantetheine-binding protein [Actinokineospora auranticolor]|uniref:Acyl carrier protein n=1 Tax=Actinokineospora auranticolor TaxID=155976 RepID=A0A2S6GSZ8_9PSEU|nr:phosphopantetheine-binding protein [Actinokineospora auranticolor]PPK68372.1 acyl carrier protein [Actinokineospora auranticolor]
MGPVGSVEAKSVELTDEQAELRDRVTESMADLLPRVLKREVTELSAGTKLFTELGLSSASTLELLLELEDELEIQIDVEEIDQGDLETVGTLAAYIATHTVADE